ncbi:MAG: YdeI/OmpD-associated family protein [bacterium]|nr:YdeI/OmpD-associated family protein [bacterium]
MTRPGLAVVERAKADGSWSAFDVVEDLVLPEQLQAAFAKNAKAAENFEKLSLSVRKQILYYIYSAKQEETRKQRVEKLLPSLAEGKNPFIG